MNNEEERFTLLLVLISLSWAGALGIYALKGPLFHPCGKRRACASACKSVCILCLLWPSAENDGASACESVCILCSLRPSAENDGAPTPFPTDMQEHLCHSLCDVAANQLLNPISFKMGTASACLTGLLLCERTASRKAPNSGRHIT